MAVATESLGQIEIELATFADEDSVLDEVKTAVAGIENFPPAVAERPEVELLQAALEVMTLAVTSPTAFRGPVTDRGPKRVRDELLALPSISQVVLRGTRDRKSPSS